MSTLGLRTLGLRTLVVNLLGLSTPLVCLLACSERAQDVGTLGPQREAVDSEAMDSEMLDAAQAPSVAVADAGAQLDCSQDACPAGQECRVGDCSGVKRCGVPSVCSAAPATLACGCDGVFISLAAGCPGPHAWGTRTYEPYYGTPCPVDTPLILSELPPLDLQVSGSALLDFEGRLLRLELTAPFMYLAPQQAARVTNGSFEMSWAGVGPRNYSSFGAALLFDLDEDGLCRAGEPLLRLVFSNPYNITLTSAAVDVGPEQMLQWQAECSDWPAPAP